SHPRASHCSPLFDPVITILKTMVTRLHSPPARQPNLTFYKGLSQLAEKLSDALDDLIGCLDPGDSSGIRRVFFGPNGLIERALRQIRNLVGR
ncbi:hypothetical protein RZS08_08500, partial [Arthrospira platensis SPKY1]|nr:hypothetical protein [Arthrospira platensis SPKY1]